MRSKHYAKFISNLLKGFIFLTAGIFLTLFVVTEDEMKQKWYIWGLGIALLINIGLYFLGTAIIHKVKSDLSRKRRHREDIQEFTTE